MKKIGRVFLFKMGFGKIFRKLFGLDSGKEESRSGDDSAFTVSRDEMKSTTETDAAEGCGIGCQCIQDQGYVPNSESATNISSSCPSSDTEKEDESKLNVIGTNLSGFKSKFSTVRVFYASEGGRSKSLARKFAEYMADETHFPNASCLQVTFNDLASMDPEDLGQEADSATSNEATSEALYVFFISTYSSEGMPPDSSKWIFEWVKEALVDFRVDKDYFRSLNYVVFGVGDSSYGEDSFNSAAKNFNEWLKQLKANRLFPMGSYDSSCDGKHSF